MCSIPVKWTSNTNSRGWGTYCSKACMDSDKDTLNKKRAATNMKKFGGHPMNNAEMIQQRTQRCLNKYGVDNPRKSELVKTKIKQTMITLYGVENAFHSPKIQEKIKQTLLTKYGVEYPAQNKQIQEKHEQTCQNKYGVSHPAQHPEIQEKMQNTNLQKYGAHPSQRHIINILPLLQTPDWLIAQYITHNHTTESISSMLGVDKKTILRYLHKHNIPIKQVVKFSHNSIKWMTQVMIVNNIHIQHGNNGGEFRIPNTKISVDGYCQENNTVYEFHGDRWHGNPKIFQPNDQCHPHSNLSAGELYKKTINRENLIKSLGYNLVVMWEGDFNHHINNQDKQLGAT